MIKKNIREKSFFERVPHAITIVFFIILLVTGMTYILPAGSYERINLDGRSTVVPGSYKIIDSTPIGVLQMFKAIPLGFKSASEIIFIVLAGGIMFGFMEKSKAIENAIGTLIKKMGLKRKYLIVVIMTFTYGLLGVSVGLENNIALIPVAAVLSLALGGDLILAAGISVGAMTIGFGLSPINPYTIGTGHKIAELPMFSGAFLRAILCSVGLAVMAFYNVRYFKKIILNDQESLAIGLNTKNLTLSKPIKDYSLSITNWSIIGIFILGLILIIYGVFNLDWHINELSAVFLIIAFLTGLFSKMGGNSMSKIVLESVAVAAPGAFMVGFATTIKVLMEMGNIGDTISYQLSIILEGLPLYLSAVCMSISQSFINFFIPSGSGQALATLPVMIPLGESLGLNRQITILAFQVGDGLTNLINPTLGGLIAMLSMSRVPIDRWIRFIFPVLIILIIIAFLALIVAVAIDYN
ncbi:C4-dicarboxylate ABC transporter [Bacteroidetes bacterium SCGC AAA795-G10]|nr:C4-dicarboxylate ABC transporter [Bacteroidetes bacterium SCGC AAA795-G10]